MKVLDGKLGWCSKKWGNMNVWENEGGVWRKITRMKEETDKAVEARRWSGRSRKNKKLFPSFVPFPPKAMKVSYPVIWCGTFCPLRAGAHLPWLVASRPRRGHLVDARCNTEVVRTCQGQLGSSQEKARPPVCSPETTTTTDLVAHQSRRCPILWRPTTLRACVICTHQSAHQAVPAWKITCWTHYY